jgi:hypothetical protein
MMFAKAKGMSKLNEFFSSKTDVCEAKKTCAN